MRKYINVAMQEEIKFSKAAPHMCAMAWKE